MGKDTTGKGVGGNQSNEAHIKMLFGYLLLFKLIEKHKKKKTILLL